MNATEAAKLLAILATIDGREVDSTRAQGWAWALDDVPYDRAVTAAKNAILAGVRYVDVLAIRAQLRAMQPRLEADVRSAKARGIVPPDWDPKRPLTAVLEARLREAHATEYAATNDQPGDITPVASRPADIGEIGRTL